MRKLIFDVETNGLLKTMTTMHCLVIRDLVTRETFRFRRHNGWFEERVVDEAAGWVEYIEHPPEDTIAEGVKMLEEAELLAGHNIVHFDIPAVRKLFPDFNPQGEVIDTLVLVRMIMPDIKDHDFRLHQKGLIPGNLIGSHSLDAWGWRLGKHKGDYAKEMQKQGLDPWASWNQPMEDYCVNDVDVNEILYAACQKDMPPEKAVVLEHSIHDLVGVMERNGYFFDMAAAERLQQELQSALESLVAEAKKRYGFWYAPAKKKMVKPLFNDPEGVNRAKKYEQPNTEWGEDLSRAVWAEITFPKKTMRSKLKGDRTEGAPYCKIECKEFNPASRPHIIDRFTTVHQWQPEEFTEKGNPEVNDAVLQKLKDTIPEAGVLAEVLFHQKLLGQLANGPGSWMKMAQNGKVHPYTNTGGTVTGRCAHVGPNIGQVPAVMTGKDVNGKKIILWGRDGEYGANCRALFYTPPPFKQVGVDLSGIEFRCLAELVADFDGGELIEVVLNGDIHSHNMEKCGIDQRDIIKRVLYGLLYGAGDYKLGHTANPTASDDEKKRLGGELRAKLMSGLPALKKAIDRVQNDAAKGWILALDGRKLKVRSKHSALNLRLQSDAAMIAKKWVTLAEEYLLASGLDHGWDGDFAMLAFVHDEVQTAVREEYAEQAAKLIVKAAGDAGKFFNFRCRIDAEAKIGANWMECH